MKFASLAIAAIVGFLAFAEDADAQLFRRRGGDNTVITANGFGGAQIIQSRSGGLFGRRNSDTVINVNGGNAGLVRSRGNRSTVLSANGFNGGRVDNFGNRVFVNRRQRVFEVDAYGNSRFRGNAFDQGFKSSSYSRSEFFRSSTGGFSNRGRSCNNGLRFGY